MPNIDTDKFGLPYLWHLQAIGLLDELGDIACESWAKPSTNDNAKDSHKCACSAGNGPAEKRLTRVAIIDNGAASAHPNLIKQRMETRIDLASGCFAASFTNSKETLSKERPKSGIAVDVSFALKTLNQALSKLNSKKTVGGETPVPNFSERDLNALLDPGFPPTAPIWFPIPDLQPDKYDAILDPSHRFAAHGTACAGLVGANANPSEDPLNPHTLRYSGVDPFARIIPINTPYNHEYWPLILALLFAVQESADVILFPRAVEDMADPEQCGEEDDPEAAQNPRYSRFLSNETRFQQKLLFENILEAVSQVIPVVVAAGNSGPGPLEYPARLTTDKAYRSRFTNLIVVGAVTAYGTVASYSAGRPNPGSRYSDDVTIYAPSDDREEISAEFARFDELSWTGRRLPKSRYGLNGKKAGDGEYCPYKILAIDIPGTYGYSVIPNDVGDLEEPGSSFKDKNTQVKNTANQPISLYTLFGGTSAAASIVAGTISCIVRHVPDRAALSVEHIKTILEKAKKVAPDLRPPKPDCPDENDEKKHSSEEIRFLDACEAIKLAQKHPDSIKDDSQPT